MARGRKTGGRAKGTPNRATTEARELFALIYQRRLPDLERWLTETGDGYQCERVAPDGSVVTVTEKNPAKAAELLVKMAQHFVPRLAQVEATGAGGGPLVVEIRDLAATAEATGD